MAGNTFGKVFKLTTFGESHGLAIGGVIDGVPSNFPIDTDLIQSDLNKRRPGQSNIVSSRKEEDRLIVLSGIYNGKTTGAPIGFMIENTNQKAKDYSHLENVYRPSHADFTYDKKYGNRDFRGGGRSSARETACRVVAGSIAKQFLISEGIRIIAFVDQVGNIGLSENDTIDYNEIELNSVRCPNSKLANLMETKIKEVKSVGDTIGGCITCHIMGVPAGLGEPVFDKLHADLGKSMLSINAVKGFEYGSGFNCASMLGSEHNDEFMPDGSTNTNHSGGIQGGISNSALIKFRVAFKPVATIMKDQKSINNVGEEVIIKGKGRHDPCVVPRAVVIVESMSALVIMDHLLLNRLSKF